MPISDQLAKDVKEKPPSEQTIHLQIVNTGMHRKITELTELLEKSLKTEHGLRRRLELAEARAAAAEDKMIDLQGRMFELELKNLQGGSSLDMSSSRRQHHQQQQQQQQRSPSLSSAAGTTKPTTTTVGADPLTSGIVKMGRSALRR